MSSVDPFSSRFEVFGREARQVVPEINGEAFERLIGHLSPEPGADGRVVLLSAPRAGYGKSLLIQRVSESLTENHHFVKVTLMGGRTIDAAHVLEFVLESLCQLLPATEGLTMLDLVARRIIARGLEPLVRSGEVPCQDRDGALLALQESPVETFDFHHESAVTAHWTEANFEILGPRLAAEVAQVSGASLREAAYWVELLFRFATTSPENVERSRLLFETVFRPEGLKPSESGAGERLHGLLSLLGIATTMVLVIDDTEGLSTHPPDALELSSFLTNLAQTCPGTLVLLSVNTDVWDTAFAPRLPGGLADRLTEHRVLLAPLSMEGAESIVRSRGGARASEVLERMSWGDGELYARRVLKAASEAWELMVRESKEEAAAEAAAQVEDKVEEVEELKPAPMESSEPVVEPEVGAVSFSPGAATFLAKEDVDPPVEEAVQISEPEEVKEVIEDPVAEAIVEDLKSLDTFEPSAYATPTTPLTEESVESSEEVLEKGEVPDPVSQLATPSEPLVPEVEKAEVPASPFDLPPAPPVEPEPEAPSEPKAEEAPANPFAPVGVAAGDGFSAVEPGSLVEGVEADEEVEEAPVSAEKPASPFAAGSPATPPLEKPFEAVESDQANEAEAKVEMSQPEPPAEKETPAGSPFARVWEKAEAEAAKVDSADEEEQSGDVWADEAPGPPSSPFAAATPTVPSSPFAPADQSDADEGKAEGEAAAAEQKIEETKSSPFSPIESEEKSSEVELGQESKPAPSPFAAAEPTPSAKVSPPESSAAAPSPFEAVSPSPENSGSQDGDSAKGLSALTGGSSVSEPVSPFEKGAPGKDEPEAKQSPPPFSPVSGSIPAKRPDPSPFSPARNVGATPFEKASAPGSEEGVPKSTTPPFSRAEEPASEQAVPPPLEEKAVPPQVEETGPVEEVPPTASPFSPVGPPPEKPASSPFSAVGGESAARGSSADEDEDKVDELLRQFKERYGRD